MSEIRDLFRNPWPNTIGGWKIFNGTGANLELRMSGNGQWMFWRSIDTSSASVSYDIECEPGNYVVSFTNYSSTHASTLRIKDVGDGFTVVASTQCPSGNMVLNTIECTVTSGMQVILDFPKVKEASGSYGRFLCCSKDDWNALQQIAAAGRIATPWFAPPINGTPQTKYPYGK